MLNHRYKKHSCHIAAACCSALALLVSCVTSTALDPETEPEVIVNCVLKYPNDIQELTLCYTTSTNGIGGEGIGDAEIVLHDDTDGRKIGEFSHKGDGRWTLSTMVVPRHGYSVQIHMSNGLSLEASTTVPMTYCVNYEPWSTSTLLEHIYDSSILTVKTSTCYHTDSLGDDPLWIYALTYDASTSSWRFVDKIMTDCQAVDPFNNKGGRLELPGQTYIAKSLYGWRRATFKDAGYHYRYLRIQSPGQYLYNPPSSNAITDWEVPMISRSSQSSFYLEMELSAPYILQEEWEEWSMNNPLPYALPYEGPEQPCSHVVFMFCSEEYDRYLKGCLSYLMRKNSNDITAIYDKSNVYGNIQGGHGIFGACISYCLPWFPAGNFQELSYE